MSGRHGRDELEAVLDAGADDYVEKPVGKEIAVLVERRLARGLRADDKRRLGGLILRSGRRGAWVERDGAARRLPLTPKETDLLHALADHLSRPLSRDAIIREVWGEDSQVTHHAVDSNVHHLRSKLRRSGLIIESVRGVGYKLIVKADAKPGVGGGGRK